MLIEHYLNLERFVLVLDPEFIISKEEEQPLFEALAKLKLNTPIQYITGESSFMELEFKVNEHVLIPRPETEELVRWITSDYSDEPQQKPGELKILDIGTGSGCIAVTLAKYFKNAKVYALDYSEQVLNIAAANALRNEVSLEFIQADILELEHLNTKFDIIVSNPPYVRESEKSQMHQNVLGYEPAQALFVTDENPLVFYKKIAHLAVKHLRTGGTLFLEINQYLGEETVQVLERLGFVEIVMRNGPFWKFSNA